MQHGSRCYGSILGGTGCVLQSTNGRAEGPPWVALRSAEGPRCELSAGIACSRPSVRVDVCHKHVIQKHIKGASCCCVICNGLQRCRHAQSTSTDASMQLLNVNARAAHPGFWNASMHKKIHDPL